MSDVVGHKRLLVSGYAILGVCSGFAGFSAFFHGELYLGVCRGLQAMMIPNALALLGRAGSKGIKKNPSFALFEAMASWGFVAGCFFGGLFAFRLR